MTEAEVRQMVKTMVLPMILEELGLAPGERFVTTTEFDSRVEEFKAAARQDPLDRIVSACAWGVEKFKSFLQWIADNPLKVVVGLVAVGGGTFVIWREVRRVRHRNPILDRAQAVKADATARLATRVKNVLMTFEDLVALGYKGWEAKQMLENMKAGKIPPMYKESPPQTAVPMWENLFDQGPEQSDG